MHAWPGNQRVAVTVIVLLELWSEGNAPQYGPNTTSLKPGTVDYSRIDWSHYGSTEGVWRFMRILDRHQLPATFLPSGRVLELYPEAIRAIDAAGHTLGGHSYTQDTILAQLSPEDERAVIKRCVSLFESVIGKRPEGWASPVTSYTRHTNDFLIEEGFRWHLDAKDCDLPRIIETNKGRIVAMPGSEFSDNRTLKGNPLDLYDVYRETFDYLYKHEPGSLLGLAFHCHSGGRPVVAAMLDKILGYFKQYPDVWYPRHGELAQWALDHDNRSTYAARQREA